MQSGAYHNFIRMGRWQRCTAVLLLGLAFFDLTVIDAFSPQLCDEGVSVNTIFTSDGLQELEPKNTVAATLLGADSLPQPDRQSEAPDSSEEDCFCCCAHILLVLAYVAEPLNISERAYLLPAFALPTAPTQNMFRPPRLA